MPSYEGWPDDEIRGTHSQWLLRLSKQLESPQIGYSAIASEKAREVNGLDIESVETTHVKHQKEG